MIWAGHAGLMGERRGVHRFLVGKPKESGILRDPDIDGRIILRWVLRKWDVGV